MSAEEAKEWFKGKEFKFARKLARLTVEDRSLTRKEAEKLVRLQDEDPGVVSQTDNVGFVPDKK